MAEPESETSSLCERGVKLLPVADAVCGRVFHGKKTLPHISYPQLISHIRATTPIEYMIKNSHMGFGDKYSEDRYIVNPEPFSSPPIFIIGCHRSGTTLLRYLVETHERIACPPESKFLAALESLSHYPQVGSALFSFGLARDEIFKRLRQFAESFFIEYAEKKGKKRWADKTPNYYKILPFIDELFASEPLYIVIVRDPLDCVDSIWNYFDLTEDHEDPDIAHLVRRYGDDRFACAKYWRDFYEKVNEFYLLFSERVHIIKYEDIVRDPEAAMNAVFHFICEDPVSNIASAMFKARHDAGYGDKKIRSTNKIHQQSIGRWASMPSAEADALWDIVAVQARRYGYNGPRRS